MPEWSELWWSSITGPCNLCGAVAHSLHDRKNVCLVVPDDLPWRDEMRACIETEMHRLPDMESFCVEFIDVADDCAVVADIGRYLLDRFAMPEIAAGYRQRSKIQQYLLDSHVLDSRVLWIKGMDPEQEKRWLQFCRDYLPGRELDGRFVIEARWTRREVERRNLVVISYSAMINQHDLTLFNSIFLNTERHAYSPIWQQYVTTLCSLLGRTDAQTSYALLDRCNFLTEEPVVGMSKVASDERYQRRGESNAEHILHLVRNGNTTKIDAIIWKAQLQVLFPLLEIERVSFIERYREQIQEAITEDYYDYRTGRSQKIYQFGEPINNPDDAELGTIYRMTKLKRASDMSQYLLYIPGDSSRQRLDLLHELRNALAHGKACSIAKVAEFINSHPYIWG